jgi:hypothetical protein
MDEVPIFLSEAVTISVERMMRFCYIAQMALELAEEQNENDTAAQFPPKWQHLTRWGTLQTLTGSMLYSLFDRRTNSTNLLRDWTEFDHPFRQALEEMEKRLQPFMGDLCKVRSSYDFHGNLTQAHQAEGFSIYQDPQRSQALLRIVHAMKQLAVNMIVWHMSYRPATHAYIRAFQAELLDQSTARSPHTEQPSAWPKETHTDETSIRLSEAVTISVERMIRFCYFVQIMLEQPDPQRSGLPCDLTRWGTLLFLTGSFLYSLFDDNPESIHLVRVWSGFPHPFGEELQSIDDQLAQIKDDLRYVRNR